MNAEEVTSTNTMSIWDWMDRYQIESMTFVHNELGSTLTNRIGRDGKPWLWPPDAVRNTALKELANIIRYWL